LNEAHEENAALIAPLRVTLAIVPCEFDVTRSSVLLHHHAEPSDMDAFLADVAITRQIIGELVAAGCRYIQIDAPGCTAYADKVSLERMRSRGEDPEHTRNSESDVAFSCGLAPPTML
jgi:hypothetical protein